MPASHSQISGLFVDDAGIYNLGRVVNASASPKVRRIDCLFCDKVLKFQIIIALMNSNGK